MSEQMITVGENQIACYTQGSGAPVVLVHGFPFDHTMWSNQIEALSSRCQVIVPDLRGYGNSTMAANDADEGVDMATYASDLSSVLDYLQVVEPVILCGFSMGGYILWQFAKQFPDRVKAIVPCDTRAVADSAEAAAGRLATADSIATTGTAPLAEGMLPKLLSSETFEGRPELVEQVSAMIRAASPTAIAASLRGMARRPDVQNELASFDWPALVLVGAEDAISPSDEMRALAASLPHGQFCEIAQAGHMTPLENPQAFNRALIDFVESL